MNTGVSNFRQQTLRRAIVLIAICTLAGLALGIAHTSHASASTYTFCNRTVGSTDYCPGTGYPFNNCGICNTAGERHTYVNNRSSFNGMSSPSPCALVVNTGSVVAYESSNGSGWKYSGYRCNYVDLKFPDNNQLLRNYTFHNDSQGRFLTGKADY